MSLLRLYHKRRPKKFQPKSTLLVFGKELNMANKEQGKGKDKDKKKKKKQEKPTAPKK
ncbi:MAG: hypothetical protein Q7T89_06020 [Anaerolineales bacterium]|nr:hypothetical protein [Anaerolineales bacterium]